MSNGIDARINLNPQEFQKAAERGVITDGLSEEALSYVDQAAHKTEEKDYSIFDKHGLMPENLFDLFGDEREQGRMAITSGGETIELYMQEDGTYTTEDGRISIDRNENGYTFQYDSDGTGKFDRTASYEYVKGVGMQKIEELFDADENGVNEVELKRDYTVHEDSYSRTYTNPELQKGILGVVNSVLGEDAAAWLGGFFGVEPTQTSTIKGSEVTKNVYLGVNADNAGNKGTNHVEYEEFYNENTDKAGFDSWHDDNGNPILKLFGVQQENIQKDLKWDLNGTKPYWEETR